MNGLARGIVLAGGHVEVPSTRGDRKCRTSAAGLAGNTLGFQEEEIPEPPAQGSSLQVEGRAVARKGRPGVGDGRAGASDSAVAWKIRSSPDGRAASGVGGAGGEWQRSQRGSANARTLGVWILDGGKSRACPLDGAERVVDHGETGQRDPGGRG